MAVQGAEACADFEGLLLQGRACLDRLARLLASRFRNNTNSFRSIPNILRNSADTNDEAARLLEIIDAADQWFGGTFGKIDNSDALRDLVAHDHSLTEGIHACFAAHRFGQNEALIIDCEIQLPRMSQTVPVLQTSMESAKWLSHIVLDCASVVLGINPIGVTEYESTWTNRAVFLSSFVVDEPPGSPLGAHALWTPSRMTLDGVEGRAHNVDPSLFRQVIPIEA